VENVRLKSSSVSDLPSKKALGDVGNKLKPFSDAQESRKLLVAGCDQENSFIKPPAKTPLHKICTVVQKSQTPNLKSTVRTPLSDIKAPSSLKKQPLQNPPKSATFKNSGKNVFLSKTIAVENNIKDDFEDLSWKPDDDVDAYEPIGLYNVKSKVQSTPIISPYAIAHSHLAPMEVEQKFPIVLKLGTCNIGPHLPSIIHQGLW